MRKRLTQPTDKIRKRPLSTYVHRSSRVKAKNTIEVPKHSKLGTSAVTSKNLANSREDQARSKYRPPL